MKKINGNWCQEHVFVKLIVPKKSLTPKQENEIFQFEKEPLYVVQGLSKAVYKYIPWKIVFGVKYHHFMKKLNK